MKNNLLFITLIFFISCSEERVDKSIQIAECFKIGNTTCIKEEFFSDKLFNEIENVEGIISQYKTVLEGLEIDKREAINYDTIRIALPKEYFKIDSGNMIKAFVPFIERESSSFIPHYFLTLNYLQSENQQNLIGFNLHSTKNPEGNLEILDDIDIMKDDIQEFSFMYEGGHKNPLVFKRLKVNSANNIGYKEDLDSLLGLINNASIVKSKKEVDTRRFKGDPELGIIHIDLKNQYTWTLFLIISEEIDKKEDFYGDLEVRYYKYLNNAVTYWIEVNDKKLLREIMLRLCHEGQNLKN